MFCRPGPRSNDNLLQWYGFVAADNPDDDYVLDNLIQRLRALQVLKPCLPAGNLLAILCPVTSSMAHLRVCLHAAVHDLCAQTPVEAGRHTHLWLPAAAAVWSDLIMTHWREHWWLLGCSTCHTAG